jgi:hypothetical protein
MSPSSGWLNLVQMDGEVMCSSTCVHYIGQCKGVWPVGHLCVCVWCVRRASSHHNFIYFNQIIRPEDGGSMCLILSEQTSYTAQW